MPMKIGICAHPSDVTEITDPPFDYLEGNVQGFLALEKIECNWTAGMREGVGPAVQALRRQLDDV